MLSPKQLFAGAVAAALLVLPAYAFAFGRPASSAEIKLWFKLSSLLHTAYRAALGHGRSAGTGSSLLFLIPRRRRDG